MQQIRNTIILIALVSLVAACSGANPLDPDTILVDTMGLPYAYQANLIAAAPYDDSQPPGSMGLPEHVQINFGVTDPADNPLAIPSYILYQQKRTNSSGMRRAMQQSVTGWHSWKKS